jgi:hypothetical protein
MNFDEAIDVELAYGEDARSVHTVLRVMDPDSKHVAEALFDNLTTPMYLIATNGLKPHQEFIGFQPLPEDLPDRLTLGPEFGERDGTEVRVLHEWREKVSGSTDETLFIECFGDPAILASEEAS